MNFNSQMRVTGWNTIDIAAILHCFCRFCCLKFIKIDINRIQIIDKIITHLFLETIIRRVYDGNKINMRLICNKEKNTLMNNRYRNILVTKDLCGWLHKRHLQCWRSACQAVSASPVEYFPIWKKVRCKAQSMSIPVEGQLNYHSYLSPLS